MEILLDTIRQRLFESPAVRNRILRDYSILEEPATPAQFADAIIAKLNQEAANQPLDEQLSNDHVFQASVKALASNSRRWATFLQFEPPLRELLRGYSPSLTHEAFEQGALALGDLESLWISQRGHERAAWLRFFNFHIDAFSVDHGVGQFEHIGAVVLNGDRAEAIAAGGQLHHHATVHC